MICPNCSANNIEGSSFCIKCGQNLKETQKTFSDNSVFTQNPQIIKDSPELLIDNQTLNNIQPFTTTISNAPFNYLKYIIGVLLRPFKAFKEEEVKLCDTKTSLIFSSIIAVVMMLINLFTAMISVIFTKTLNYSTFKYQTSIDFSRLKDLDWLNLIGKNLLICAGIIVAIAFVYYIVGLVFKKSTNFIKILSVSATSLIPYVVLAMIVSPLIGKIWAPLSMIAMVVGTVYSMLIFINIMNDELVFDNIDFKIHFHLICLSILGSAGYYLCMKLMVSGISSNINDLFNIFG